MPYGIPYQGSKNGIANFICDNLPPGETLVDLFGGGGAITHCAILHYNNKWNNFIYNDYDSSIVNLFKDVCYGKYKTLHRFITKDEFTNNKDKDPYTAVIWSFANSRKSYIYGYKREKYIKSIYDFLFDNKINKNLLRLFHPFFIREDLRTDDIKYKLSEFKKYFRDLYEPLKYKKAKEKNIRETIISAFYRMQSLERDERLIKMYESLNGKIDNLKIKNCDYKKYKYKKGDIVYCDIPYENTADYNHNEFDHKTFYDWCYNSPFQIFFSSYEMESLNKNFILVAKKEKRETYNAYQRASGKQKYNMEVLYTNKK